MAEPLVVFEDPPAATIQREGKWTAHLELVKARPLEWARIATGLTTRRASSLRTQLLRQQVYGRLAAGGRFESVARLMHDGKTGVWVRYLPPAPAEPRLEGEQHLEDLVDEAARSAEVGTPAAVDAAPPELPDPPAVPAVVEAQETAPPREVEVASPAQASAAAPRRQFSEQARRQGDRIRPHLTLPQRQCLAGLARLAETGDPYVVKVNVIGALIGQGLVEGSNEIRAVLRTGNRDGSHYPLTEAGEYLAARERGAHLEETIHGDHDEA